MAAKKPASTDENPFGSYVRAARDAAKLSIREAARRADISDTRWRQIEAGTQQVAKGVHVPVQPKVPTVIAVCRAVHADPSEGLRLAGYNPEHWQEQIQQSAEPELRNELDREWFLSLPADERSELLAELQRLHVVADLDLSELAKRRGTG